MLNEDLISLTQYRALLEHFIDHKPHKQGAKLIVAFEKYENKYLATKDTINPEKVFLAIDGYAKGILAHKLENVGVEIALPKNIETADLFRGMPGAPGAAKGIAHILRQDRPRGDAVLILVADSNHFSPDDIDLVWDSAAVVTTNCGMTGHLPLICRGIKKGCVILSSADFSQIRNGDKVLVSGSKGIVAVGLLVE